MITLVCHTCGKKYSVIPYRKDKSKYCSRKCHYESRCGRPAWNRGKRRSEKTKKKISIAKRKWAATQEGREKIKTAVQASVKANATKWKNGTHPLQDPYVKTKALKRTVERNYRRIEDGTHPLLDPKNRIKAMTALAQHNHGGTRLEKKIGLLLDDLNLEKKAQKPIPSGHDVRGKQRYLFPDWFVPNYNLIIECDGEYWHQDEEREKQRDAVFFEQGYRVLHLTGTEIRENLDGCRTKIENLIM